MTKRVYSIGDRVRIHGSGSLATVRQVDTGRTGITWLALRTDSGADTYLYAEQVEPYAQQAKGR